MRKILLFFVFSLFAVFSVQADNKEPIKFNQLPQSAQQLVQKYFSGEKVVMVVKEKDWLDVSYDLQFQSGGKIEFAKNGVWKEIRMRNGAVPSSLISSEIKDFVKKHYPDAKIVKIEKDKYEYEILLSNRYEIKFDKNYNVIDMDME